MAGDAVGQGTKDDPWVLKTPSGTSEYTMHAMRRPILHTLCAQSECAPFKPSTSDAFLARGRTVLGIQRPATPSSRLQSRTQYVRRDRGVRPPGRPVRRTCTR
jgi:hypothetical protein